MGNISTLGYIHSEKLVKWVMIFICLQAAMAVVGMVSGYMEYSLLQDYADDVFQSEAMARAAGDSNDLRQAIVVWTQILITTISAVFILKWIYRANYNAHELGASNMTFSPAMSVGWFFVPIMVLWKPYQSMVQIWKASHEPVNWRSAKGHPIVGIWWALFVVTVVIGCVSYVMVQRASDISTAVDAVLVKMVSDFSALSLTLVMLILMKRINQAQLNYIEAS